MYVSWRLLNNLPHLKIVTMNAAKSGHKFWITSPDKMFDDIMVYIASPPPPPRPPLPIDRDDVNALTRKIFT